MSRRDGTYARWALGALAGSLLVLGCSKHESSSTGTSAESTSKAEAAGAPGKPAPADSVHTEAAQSAAATAGGPDRFCEGTRRLVADKAACLACEQAKCDTPVVPGCNRFPAGSAERSKCEDVLACIRTTGCINRGNVMCYCGDADVVACKSGAANANGACKARITAAFPGGYSSAKIVDEIGTYTIPGGAALALGECDLVRCGEQSARECLPYCSR